MASMKSRNANNLLVSLCCLSGLLDDCVPQQESSSKLGKVCIPLLFHCEMDIYVSSFSPIEGVVEFVVLLGHDLKFPVAYWLHPTIAAVCRERF